MRNYSHRMFLIFLLLVFIGWPLRKAGGAGLEADMVVLNAKILTVDSPDSDRFRTAQAAAIYDGKFVAVGSNQEVLQYAGASTQRIDVGGRTVLPGLVETHDHLYEYGVHWFPKGIGRIWRLRSLGAARMDEQGGLSGCRYER